MKHFLLLFITLTSFSAFAQAPLPIDKETGHIVFTGEIGARAVTQPELYLRTKAFFNTYKALDNTLDILRDEPALLSGRAYTDIVVNDGASTEKQRLWYTLSVELADGKLRYALQDFSLQRYCIPARGIPCEVQTKTVAMESILPASSKKKARKTPGNPYSPELALEKAASSLINALEAASKTDGRLAGAKPE